MKKTYLILILLIAAGIGGWFFFFRDSDEQRISKNLNRIIELAEKRGDESVFVLIGDSRKIMRQISEFPEIDLGSPLPLITDREELESAIIQFRQSVRSLSVRVVRSEIRISESGDRAQMELELMGKGD